MNAWRKTVRCFSGAAAIMLLAIAGSAFAASTTAKGNLDAARASGAMEHIRPTKP